MGEFVKPKITHDFNNYFDYIIYIIASNLFYFIYFFRLGINKIKREEKTSKFGFYTYSHKDGPKIIIYERYYFHNYLIGLGFQELEKS